MSLPTLLNITIIITIISMIIYGYYFLCLLLYYYYGCWYYQYLFCLPSLLLLLHVIVTWNDMPMGGLAQAFFSRVVAISSTEATSALSVCPVKRLIFHTKACFLASYFALPACWV